MRTILKMVVTACVCILASGPVLYAAEGAAVVCPTCALEMPASFHFCSNCGTNLENASPATGAGEPVAIAQSGPRTQISHPTVATHSVPAKEEFHFSDFFGGSAHHESALSEVPSPLSPVPDRPKPIIEWGQNPFLGRGPIAPGVVLPTGAVWQPVFIVYGTGRTAIQTFDDGTGQVTDWANRLDLYGNLYLSPTERFLIGFRPLDRNGLDYSGYRFDPPPQRLKNDLNAYVTTLFFQGDFGELFPNLDPGDTKRLDIGFSIGRQPLSFQDGIMINEDVIDAIGITRTSNFFLGSSAWRTTGIFAWGELNRNNNVRESNARLFGLFNTADYAKDTIDLDFAYVTTDGSTGGDGFYLGVGDTRRFGLVNSTTRINASFALDRETPAVSTGLLLFQQLSTTLPGSDDFVYLDAFWGIGDYSSAARGGDRGGPLGQIGILFAAQGLGAYGAPLGNRANDAVGAAVGYQKFLGGTDKQLTFELGGRVQTRDPQFFDQPNSIAGAVRYQMKLSQHFVLIFDTFVGFPEDRDTAYGFRSELLLKF